MTRWDQAQQALTDIVERLDAVESQQAALPLQDRAYIPSELREAIERARVMISDLGEMTAEEIMDDPRR